MGRKADMLRHTGDDQDARRVIAEVTALAQERQRLIGRGGDEE
jgi:hypothetical protein